jgi:hypothetical protein
MSMPHDPATGHVLQPSSAARADLRAAGPGDLRPARDGALVGRPRLARSFAWRQGGPLQKFFQGRVQKEFFESSFHGEGELRFVINGALSAHSNALLRGRMKKLAEEFDAAAEDDQRLDHKTLSGTTRVVAIRPWELGIFNERRREK